MKTFCLIFLLTLSVSSTSALGGGTQKTNAKLQNLKEVNVLIKKGYLLKNSVTCDLNNDGKPETAILLINKKRNASIIGILDKGKFIKLNDNIPADLGDIDGCKVMDTPFGKTPRNAFGVVYFVGESYSARPAFYRWNGSKYEEMGHSDFSLE